MVYKGFVGTLIPIRDALFVDGHGHGHVDYHQRRYWRQ